MTEDSATPTPEFSTGRAFGATPVCPAVSEAGIRCSRPSGHTFAHQHYNAQDHITAMWMATPEEPRPYQPGLFPDADAFTMVIVDEPIRRTCDIAAAELRPGDIVLTLTGDRDYAAFDVDVTGDTVTVWTATTDQAKGIPARLTLTASTALTVARKATR